ncbi:MAG: toxin-antitoxin system YwqK family antitoxin [Planctomycetes bacterium]|nr:toxin-antitoxin system YwqK family antitoxin [Planctomycetota bacterium]
MRKPLKRISLCLLVLFVGSVVFAAGEKAENGKKKEKYEGRVIVLEKDDEVPTNFQTRGRGVGGVTGPIKKFIKKMPKTHTAKIYVRRVQNMNYEKNDDALQRMVMLNPEGKKDGEEWFFVGTAEGNPITRKIPWENGVKNGIEKVYGRGKKVRHYLRKERPWENGKVEGVVKVYYSGGQIMAKVPYVHGKQEGVSKSFSEEGKLTQVVPYKKGKREGTMIQYWPKTGKKKKVVPCENGMVDGTARLFYEDGTLKAEMPFREDTLHGVEKRYDEDGELKRKRYWLDGELVPEGVFKDKYKKD